LNVFIHEKIESFLRLCEEFCNFEIILKFEIIFRFVVNIHRDSCIRLHQHNLNLQLLYCLGQHSYFVEEELQDLVQVSVVHVYIVCCIRIMTKQIIKDKKVRCNVMWENKQTSLKLKRNNKFYWKLYQIVFIKLQNIAQERKSIQEKNFNSYTSHVIRIKYIIEFERTSSIIRFNNQIQ